MSDQGPYVTKTGKVLTEADIEALADEAERGYDVSQIKSSGALCRPTYDRQPFDDEDECATGGDPES